MVAEDERGELLGFNWATRSRFQDRPASCYLIVKPAQRGRGAGRLLYDDLEAAARQAEVSQLQVGIRDDCPTGRGFAERRGFVERKYSIGMTVSIPGCRSRISSKKCAGRSCATPAPRWTWTPSARITTRATSR